MARCSAAGAKQGATGAISCTWLIALSLVLLAGVTAQTSPGNATGSGNTTSGNNTDGGNTTNTTRYCRPLNKSRLGFCAASLEEVYFDVQDNLDERVQDMLAHEAAHSEPYCSYFDLTYYCYKLFPRCTNRSGVVHNQGLCTSFCMKGQHHDALCRNYDFSKICEDNQTYMDPDPDCFKYIIPEKGMDPGLIVMVVGLILVGVALVGSILWKRHKANSWLNNPDSIEFEDERVQREAQEKAARKRAASLGEHYSTLHEELRDISAGPKYRTAQDARAEMVARLSAETYEAPVPTATHAAEVPTAADEPEADVVIATPQ